MAKASTIYITVEPNTSQGDDGEDYEEDDIASLHEKGGIAFRFICKNKIACSNFVEILTFAIESKKIIDQFQAQDEEQENTIEKLQSLSFSKKIS
jgi:hypothetical protein